MITKKQKRNNMLYAVKKLDLFKLRLLNRLKNSIELYPLAPTMDVLKFPVFQ
jgi:hypothetical protein